MKNNKIGKKVKKQEKIQVKDIPIILRDFNLQVKKGEMIAIIGPVGYGKSTIIKSIMGITYNQGEVYKNGKIAYIPQDSFLMNTSLRKNILFGKEY